jgi:monofunctional biosynthetic peptidoglycan transglycosylase
VKKAKKTRKRSLLVRALRLILFIHLWFWGVIAFFSLLYSFVNPPLTPIMLQRYLIRGYDWHQREYVKLENIPQRTVNMTLALEDGNYYKHFGFEWKMVKEAWQRNRKAGKIRFGASTVSNQLARTIFLTTDRNWVRKYLEVQVTLIMELLMTKNRMLELYFNYVEWGKGIYGIETASRYYYGTSCRNLSRGQSMSLVSILTNPLDYSPQTYYLSPSAYQRQQMLERYF